MRIEHPQPVFPALVFSQGLVALHESVKSLNYCSKLGLKKGFYENLLLVDSAGETYRVRHVRPVRTLPPNRTTIIGFFTGNPRYEVELEFEVRSASEVPLEETKGLILDSFRGKRGYWSAMSDFGSFRMKVMSAKSLEQVISAFREFHAFG